MGRPRPDAYIKEYFARFAFRATSTSAFVAYLRAGLLGATPGLEAAVQLAAWVDGPGTALAALAAGWGSH